VRVYSCDNKLVDTGQVLAVHINLALSNNTTFTSTVQMTQGVSVCLSILSSVRHTKYGVKMVKPIISLPGSISPYQLPRYRHMHSCNMDGYQIYSTTWRQL